MVVDPADAYDVADVVTNVRTFSFDDIAPRASLLPRWEVREGGQVIGTIDVHLGGEFKVFPASGSEDPSLKLALEVAASAFKKQRASDFVRRPRGRSDAFAVRYIGSTAPPPVPKPMRRKGSSGLFDK